VEVNFAAGISVVRNRYFPSPAERQQFLDTARRLAPGASTAHERTGARA
jgi:hypothetical protein